MAAVEIAVETLVSVVYVSSAYKILKHDELTTMLAEIREKNKRRGVTGMLLYRDGNYLQVVEGPANEVDRLLSVLKTDPRHKGIIVMKRSEIEERQFSDWQMAFRDLSGADLSQIEGFSPFMDLSFTDAEFLSKPHLCYKLLIRFKEQAYRFRPGTGLSR